MKNRIVFLDFVRVFACFLVMLVHASENYYPGPESTDMAGPVAMLANNTDRLWVSLYDGFSRMAVPLFIVVSAFLLVPMDERLTTGQFYRKRFKRILPPFLIFSVLYSTLPLFWRQLTPEQSIHDLAHIPLNFTSLAGHLWFMFPLMGLYLFIPVISPWIRQAGKKEERFFIILFLVSTSMPFLRRYFGEVWGECFWNEFHLLWYFAGYLGYLVIAHYIQFHLKWTVRRKIIVGLSMVILGATVTILSYYIQAVPGVLLDTPELEIGWSFCTTNVVCLTTGAFMLFSCISLKKTPRLILLLSRLSFGMYLMHIFWLHLWAIVAMQVLSLPTVASIPFMAIMTFVSSAVSTWIVSLVPGSRWIVGC